MDRPAFIEPAEPESPLAPISQEIFVNDSTFSNAEPNSSGLSARCKTNIPECKKSAVYSDTKSLAAESAASSSNEMSEKAKLQVDIQALIGDKRLTKEAK